MTISYSHKVSKVRLCGFTRLLCYWKGSIYKLLYKEMIFYVVFYTILTCVYRLALNNQQKRLFEKLVIHFDAFTNLIPMSFILGFYVSIVLTRWWAQYTNIPWPDRVATYVATMIRGTDEATRILRRSMIRYLNLASVMVFQSISTTVKKRFPTMDHLVLAGLMTEKERTAFESVESPHPKFWVPCMWCSTLTSRAREEGKITDDINLKTILDEINTYRGCLGMLFSYDWISIPLVYTQVTTLAVYTYFFACLMGRQFLDPDQGYRGHDVDLYVPLFTMLQFFFYIGWIKVAEQLINPFGEDDDDFEINWIIDRNVQVGLMMVDQMYMCTPQLERDPYWGIADPQLPYTKSTLSSKLDAPFMGSTADLSLTSNDMKVVINSTQTLEPILEGKGFCNQGDPPNTSPLKRKMYLDFNCPSPRVMSTENLYERGRNFDTHSSAMPRTAHSHVTPDALDPLLKPMIAAEQNTPLVGKDWLAYQQDQYQKSLHNPEPTDSPQCSGQNEEDSHKSNGERFLHNWLHGRPSISDDIGIAKSIKDDSSGHGAELGLDLLGETTQQNTEVTNVFNSNAVTNVFNSTGQDVNSCDISKDSDTKVVHNICDTKVVHNTCDKSLPEESKPNVVHVTPESSPVQPGQAQCSGNAYVESWLNYNQQPVQTYSEKQSSASVGRKFEQVSVEEPFANTPKLRNVSFSEHCAHIPNVEILPESVGIEMPEDEEESGRISGNSSYCTQSTVNSMKALLSSTDD